MSDATKDPFPHLPRRNFYAEPERTTLPAAKRDLAARGLEDAEAETKKRGRPSSGKPWEDMGISRALYFARKKAGAIR
jgi:hypothetical protein